MRQGCLEPAIEVHHQFCHSRLGRGDTPLVMGQTELTQERGLKTVAVQILALDPGGHHGLVADAVDGQSALLGLAKVGKGPEKAAGLMQQTRLQGRQRRRVKREGRPVGLLPVPAHEA